MIIGFAAAILIILVYRHKNTVTIQSPNGQVVTQSPLPPSNSYLTYNFPPLNGASLPTVSPATFNVSPNSLGPTSPNDCGCGCGNSNSGLVSSPFTLFSPPDLSSLLNNLSSSPLVSGPNIL